MREIKFRVWWKNKMRYNAIVGNGQALFIPGGIGGYTWVNLAECKAMQFTGLQDRNGKDIYEGDRFIDVRSHGDYVDDVFEIRFDDGKFGFSNYGIFDTQIDTDSIEVIGNIYEK